jgi:parallel beta-helix repeat protein
MLMSLAPQLAKIRLRAWAALLGSAALLPVMTGCNPEELVREEARPTAVSDSTAVDSTDTNEAVVPALAVASNSTTIYPGYDIQLTVNKYPAGTAFTLKAGVHRMQSVVPKDGDTFTGESGTILSGARLLTSFSRSGSSWVASGQTQQGFRKSIQCVTASPLCNYPEDLFINDVMLQPVTSLSQVTTGKWYFDYAADKIYFGSDPTGKRVETSVTPYAFSGVGQRVVIRNLIIEKYATPSSAGAVGGDNTAYWQVTDNQIRWNHGGGIRTGRQMQILRNNIHHQGQLGIIGWKSDAVLIEANTIAYNNMSGYYPYWEAGGSKMTGATHLTVRNNLVQHNKGKGLWTDENAIYVLIEGNTCTDNDHQGISHEVSYDAVIRNNTVERNGFQNSGGVAGGGITLNSSVNVEIYGNNVNYNADGIGAYQLPRGSGTYGPHEIKNLYVHDNIIRMSSGNTGLTQAVNDNSYYTSRNNRFVHNTYYMGTTNMRFWWMNAARSDTQWKGYGEDKTGSFSY